MPDNVPFFVGDKVRYVADNKWQFGTITQFGFGVVWDETLDYWIPVVHVHVNDHKLEIHEVDHA